MTSIKLKGKGFQHCVKFDFKPQKVSKNKLPAKHHKFIKVNEYYLAFQLPFLLCRNESMSIALVLSGYLSITLKIISLLKRKKN